VKGEFADGRVDREMSSANEREREGGIEEGVRV